MERPLHSKKLSDPARFKEIKLKNSKDALEEVQFWSHQFSEHALFLHLGLEDAALKKRGLELHNKFEEFRKNMNEKNLNDILPLVKELREYKMEVIDNLNAGKWIGWIFPAMAEHIVRELDYFVDIVNGVPYSVDDEITFWDHINADHAALEAHLFDPSEGVLSAKAHTIAEKMYALEDSELGNFIALSLQLTDQLDKFNKKGRRLAKSNKLKSIIHPVLMDHVIREGERSKAKLQKIEQELDQDFYEDTDADHAE